MPRRFLTWRLYFAPAQVSLAKNPSRTADQETFMNIVYHHRTRGTGAEGNHIKSIVDTLRLQGHVVKILSFPGVDPEKEVDKLNVSVVKPKKVSHKILSGIAGMTKNAPSFVFELFEILYNLNVIPRLSREINAHKPDFIYERYSLFMGAGVWLANRRGIPIILEVNDSALVSRIRPIFFRFLARKIEKWVFNHCDGLVFISTYFRDLAHDAYGSLAKTIISPNAADLSKFDLSKYDKNTVKSELGLQGKVVCGYTGGFGKWHGIVWFIEKLIPKIKQNPNFCLLLVGDGATFDDIQTIVKNAGMESQIILTGRVKSSTVPKYISAMDFGFLPELNAYCSPMKLFESMSMAQGMVLPASDPVLEVVEDGLTSWVFPMFDQDACVDKVMQVFEDTPQRIQVGKNARAYIERERQWHDNVNMLLKLFDEIKTSRA